MGVFNARTAPTSRSIQNGFYWGKYKIPAPGKEREIVYYGLVVSLGHL